MDLDVAFGDESSVAVREIRTGDADEKRVLARTGLTVITGIDSVLVAELLVHLGVTLERPTIARERDRGHAGVRAVYINGATISTIIVV